MSVDPKVEETDLPAPAGVYGGIAWRNDDRLITTYDSDARQDRDETGGPYELSLDGGRLTKLDPPDGAPADCFRLTYGGVSDLPDGRVGITETCEPREVAKKNSGRVLAWEPSSGAADKLVAGGGAVAYTWNPDLSVGLYWGSNGIIDGIGKVERQRYVPFPVVLRDEGVEWRIDAPTTGDAGYDSPELGRATAPDWSPDGRRIAFMASPSSVGVEGQARVDEPWKLYLMDAEELEPRPVADGRSVLTGPRWAPDARHLVFGTDDGLLLLDVDSGEVSTLTGNSTDAPRAWSPDGRRLLVGRRVDRDAGFPLREKLVVLDLSLIEDRLGAPVRAGGGA